MKTATLSDILATDAEVKRAVQLFKSCKSGTFAKTIAEELIKPKIKEINRRLGQENNPFYLAYLVEYAISQTIEAACPKPSGLN